jgi:hypothetical protein
MWNLWAIQLLPQPARTISDVAAARQQITFRVSSDRALGSVMVALARRVLARQLHVAVMLVVRGRCFVMVLCLRLCDRLIKMIRVNFLLRVGLH